MGGFSCKQDDNGAIHLKTDQNNMSLMLPNGKEIKALLDQLDSEYGGKFGWVGGRYAFVRKMRAMKKND